MKKAWQFPVSFDNKVFIVPQLLRSIGIRPNLVSDEEFAKEVAKAKAEWAKWNIHELVLTIEKLSWALYRMYHSMFQMRNEIEYYKGAFKDFAHSLKVSPVLYTYYQRLIDNKTPKEE